MYVIGGEFIENIDYPEQLLNSLKMDMNNGITNVNKSKEKTLTKEKLNHRKTHFGGLTDKIYKLY